MEDELKALERLKESIDLLHNKEVPLEHYHIYMTRVCMYMGMGYNYFVYDRRIMDKNTTETVLLKKCVLCKTRNEAKRAVSRHRKYGFEEQNNPDTWEYGGFDSVIYDL